MVIIAGDTGSGKSTQIPKMCIAANRGIHGKIACTQPRRIAATTIATRIAEELGETIGKRAWDTKSVSRTAPANGATSRW